ncbi:MAG TPA: hypothetical protein VFM15_05230 [Gammaproteobacteria bacterium]|nr:hypothetical protein [Gammaproteobacteria bacterium]
MKVYLYTTCVIFGLFSIAHVFELFFHWSTLATDGWFTLTLTAVIVVSGALSIWAFILLKLRKKTVA